MRLVMKFGGTAVDSPDKVRHIAQLIQSHKKGNEIVCVVSAVRGMTDGLLSIADSVKRGDKTSLDEFVEKVHQYSHTNCRGCDFRQKFEN